MTFSLIAILSHHHDRISTSTYSLIIMIKSNGDDDSEDENDEDHGDEDKSDKNEGDKDRVTRKRITRTSNEDE